MVLKVTYLPTPDSDVEHGQGAIERNELVHAPLTDREWLIRVGADDGARTWQSRLNETVDSKHGMFRVTEPTAEELRRVSAGEIAFQQ